MTCNSSEMEYIKFKNWQSDEPENLPDFIIGGAMKSGTTSLHAILNHHPDIYIPKGEIHFFDVDNLAAHNDFLFHDKVTGKWQSQLMEDDPERMWKWYNSKFENHGGKVKGEDSTTYLSSPIAAQRIALQKKDVKFIFMLRNPVARAYSQYYHMLRTGRATFSFEDTLKFSPMSILERSLYKEQLDVYYSYFPKERIKVVCFENFINDPKSHIKDICNFVGVDSSLLPEEAYQIHTHKARIPKYEKLQAKKNYFFRSIGNNFYDDDLPFAAISVKKQISKFSWGIYKVHNLINPHLNIKKPGLNINTRNFLNKYFYRELDGINELTGQDLLGKWFSERKK